MTNLLFYLNCVRLGVSVVTSLSKHLAVSKRSYPVYALKRLKNRIKRTCWSLQYIPEVSMDRIRIVYPAGYLQFFRIRIGYWFLKKIGSGQDQDICLISITKFSWEWFKMSQMMVAVFSLLWFLYCQYVLHSSQSMVIRVTLLYIFSGQVEVVSCSYIAGMLLCLLCWLAYVCVV